MELLVLLEICDETAGKHEYTAYNRFYVSRP